MDSEKKYGNRYIDVTGQKFGRLLVIRRCDDIYYKGEARVTLTCLCDCGKYIDVVKDNLKSGSTKSCGCFQKESAAERRRTGFEEISGSFLCSIKSSAKHRNLEWKVSNDFLWNLFLKQNRKCAITGYDINFTKSYGKLPELQTASLDRIDSLKDYTEDNVQWVHKDVNRLKFNWPIDKFYKLCEDITNYKNNINNGD